ncbi:MAG: MarR family transcriptional regulator [Crenarchaeota archaeon]|nr:MarR family transcriptional regulator [Thermoproteota archaeon]
MVTTSQEAANEILDVVPLVMKEIRTEIRNRKSLNVTLFQFRVLSFVDQHKGTSLSEVADHLGLTLPSTCRIVDGLISTKMMTRQENPDDRRHIQLNITPQGLKIFEISHKESLSYLSKKLDTLSDPEKTIISNAMKIIRKIFTTDSDGAQ